MTTAAFLSSGVKVWSGDVNLGFDGLWMVFKAMRLDEITKEVSTNGEPLISPPTLRMSEEEETGRETASSSK